MAANICWARPEVTECWSFKGRLYMSLSKAQQERKRLEKVYSRWPSYRYESAPIYRVTWGWEIES